MRHRVSDPLIRPYDRTYLGYNNTAPEPDGGTDNRWVRVLGGMSIYRDANFINEAALSPDPLGDPRTGGLNLHGGVPEDVPGAAATYGDGLSIVRRVEPCDPNDATVRFRFVGNCYTSNPPKGGAMLRVSAGEVPDQDNPEEAPTGHGYGLVVCRNAPIMIAIGWRQGGYSIPGGWLPVWTSGITAVYGDIMEFRIAGDRAYAKQNGIVITPEGGVWLGENPLQGAYHGIGISRMHFGVPMIDNYECEWSDGKPPTRMMEEN